MAYQSFSQLSSVYLSTIIRRTPSPAQLNRKCFFKTSTSGWEPSTTSFNSEYECERDVDRRSTQTQQNVLDRWISSLIDEFVRDSCITLSVKIHIKSNYFFVTSHRANYTRSIGSYLEVARRSFLNLPVNKIFLDSSSAAA